MKYVYILRSKSNQNKYYTGITSGVEKRLKSHNSGKSPYSSKFKPWDLITYIAFSNPEKARIFEKYLKTGPGRAFAKKHLR